MLRPYILIIFAIVSQLRVRAKDTARKNHVGIPKGINSNKSDKSCPYVFVFT